MKRMKKIVSLLLAVILVFGLLPAMVSAVGTEDCVYLSVSFDGKYIDDQYGDPVVYLPISLEDIAAVDLTEYGLDNMLFDGNEDGIYDTTALQLLIYAHEEIYGGDWSEVTFDAISGSSYFRSGIFGFTENLVYFLNGDFPVDESQQSDYMTVGATSDRIVLEAGDFLDVASFGCYGFVWDQAGGFHLFTDENGTYVHDYTAEAGEAMPVKLMHSFCDLMYGQAWVNDAADYEIYYGSTFGVAEGSVWTDDSGCAEVTFPSAGTYYLWCDGGHSTDDTTHSSCDYYMENGVPCIVSAPAYAKVTVTEQQAPEQPRQPQNVGAVLQATMAQMVEDVPAPGFGTNAGEWTVFSLARGNHLPKTDAYFTGYYNRIVDIVNETAASVDLNGALDKNKSTENSRLIVALSAIGKDATSVGNWNLVEAYSENGINWIKKQGMNGTIWALIALDSNNYATSDTTIRQQCVDSILSLQHDDGGWSLIANKAQTSNVDITGMTLTALYPYRNQPAVAAACAEAIAWLSEAQLTTGGFPYGTGETSESCAWAIVALSTWGINPDTDSRFIKNGNSCVDNLLSYYLEDEAMFAHQGTTSNNMATDQACYALVAYNRLKNDQPALFDYSDVTFDAVTTPETPEKDPEETPNDETQTPVLGKMTASLGLPAQINEGDSFNAVVSVTGWDNAAGYKLLDFIVSIPSGVSVTEISTGSRLSGGDLTYNLEVATGKLRVVYFDANNYSDLTVSGTETPAELVTISMQAANAAAGTNLNFAITGMSAKRSSDSADAAAMSVVDTATAQGVVSVVKGISYSAVCLYTGDDVDLIPSTKKAVAVAITGVEAGSKLTFNNGTEIAFRYSKEISEKSGVATFVALVDATIAMEEFVKEANFTIAEEAGETITFGDSNTDGVINAQDALAAVDAWLRKTDASADLQILTLNVNGDSRINTFDALGIVEAFVDGADYGVVTKAATISTQQ